MKSKDNFSNKFLVYIPVVCLGILFICFSGLQGFWFDELFSIGVVRQGVSFKDLIRTYLTAETTNPPLYDMILYFLYRILPKKEIWLLAVNSVFWMTGTLFTADLAVKLSGKITAAYVVVLYLGISVFLINNAVWELRSYSLLFMLAAIVHYLYFKAKKDEIISNLFVLGFVMVLLAFTHYFGDIVVFCYGLADLVLFIRKKVTLKCLIPYGMCVVTMGPYLLLTLTGTPEVTDDFWILPPNLYTVLDTFVTLLGNKFSFMLAFVFILFMIMVLIKEKGIRTETEETALISLFIPFAVSVLVYIYSRYVNPDASIWTARYFIAIIPSLICGVSVAAVSFPDNLSVLLNRQIVHKERINLIVLCLVGFFLLAGSLSNLISLFTDDTKLAPDNINIRNASEFMINDDADGEKIIVTTLRGNFLEGFKEFYMKDKGIDVVSFKELDRSSLKDKTVYFFCPHGNIPDFNVSGLTPKEYYDGKLVVFR